MAIDNKNTNITKPPYYIGTLKKSKKEIDVIDISFAFNCSFADANAIKYILRHKDKGGSEDLEKAIECIERVKKELY